MGEARGRRGGGRRIREGRGKEEGEEEGGGGVDK